jgi:hypothetical protein
MNANGTSTFHTMKQFVFNLNLSSRDYLEYYRGSVDKVVAQCVDGRTVQFPAGLLTPHVTSWGIKGEFVLTCDEDRKGAQLMRRQAHSLLAAA